MLNNLGFSFNSSIRFKVMETALRYSCFILVEACWLVHVIPYEDRVIRPNVVFLILALGWYLSIEALNVISGIFVKEIKPV